MKLRMTKFTAALLGLSLAISGAATFDVAHAAELKLKKRSTTSVGQTTVGGLTTGFGPSCASGFSMAGQKKGHTSSTESDSKWTDWFVCTTPVISCPKQLQNNGQYSHVSPKVVIQQTGGNPDSSSVKFRVQYKCDYSWRSVPVK